ncbi:MAG: hypothetical protein WC150_11095 [Bacteroidia bacterium]
MAVTRLKRKNRLNKTVSRQKQTMLALNRAKVNVKSPYKEQSGVIEE